MYFIQFSTVIQTQYMAYIKNNNITNKQKDAFLFRLKHQWVHKIEKLSIGLVSVAIMLDQSDSLHYVEINTNDFILFLQIQ